MENNQISPNRPPRKKLGPRDMIILALGVLVFMRVEWSNMNSFHYLIIFLFLLVLVLRWSNMRKDYARQQKIEDAKAAQAAKTGATQAAEAAAALAALKAAHMADASAAAKEAEDAAIEASAVEIAEEAPTEEKTEE